MLDKAKGGKAGRRVEPQHVATPLSIRNQKQVGQPKKPLGIQLPAKRKCLRFLRDLDIVGEIRPERLNEQRANGV